MKLRKILGTACALSLAVVLATGCGGNGNTDDGNTDGGGSETIKIGLNYEFSGGAASYGQSSVEGIKMAIAEINEAGGIDGKEVIFVEMDNKSDTAEALSIATRMMTQDKVVAVLGPATTNAFKSAVPAALEYGVPILSGSATGEDAVADANGVKEYAFRICFSDSYQGTAMANYATRNLEAKKAAIIMDSSSDYAKGLEKNFKETFVADGGEIVAESAYVQKEKDFNAILTGIKNKEFDVIFIPGYYEEAGLIIKQARAMGIDVPILGADGFDSPVLLELAGADALNNVFFTNHYSALDQDPLVIEFIDAFQAKYNKEPNAFQALGYDMGKFVADAIKRAGSDDPAAIKDAMAATTNFTGVTGTFSIDENHNAIKSITVIGLENGQQATSEKVGP